MLSFQTFLTNDKKGLNNKKTEINVTDMNNLLSNQFLSKDINFSHLFQEITVQATKKVEIIPDKSVKTVSSSLSTGPQSVQGLVVKKRKNERDVSSEPCLSELEEEINHKPVKEKKNKKGKLKFV